MADIKNVVILGDSMSDIGNKWLWPSGELGRLARAMRVNETGRFSDGRNWTDFLVEWATGESLMWGNRDLAIRKSTDYRTLTGYSVLEVNPLNKPPTPKPKTVDDYIAEARTPAKNAPKLPQMRYVNYAMGGCIVTRDWTIAPKFGALTYLRGQVEDYIAQRRSFNAFDGATMHVIWIGLNDFVTVKRPDYDPKIASLPATADYGQWRTWSQTHPKDLANGVGVFPAVAEVQSLVELVNSSFPPGDNHFMLIDLPSVFNAIRYMEGIADPDMVAEAREIDPVIRRYNEMVKSLVEHWPAGPNAPAAGHVELVQMSVWMDYVSQHMDDWKLSKQAQDRGVKPFYDPGLPSEPKTDPVAADMRRRITTSDLAHPTEAVYSIMARYFVTKLLKNGHTLGRLSAQNWSQIAPSNNLPFDIV